MANLKNTVTYTGMTSNLSVRAYQHRTRHDPASHTAKYHITKLVYHQGFHHIEEAIAEEKRIKGLSRKKKYLLISSMNPEWRDLYDEIDD